MVSVSSLTTNPAGDDLRWSYRRRGTQASKRFGSKIFPSVESLAGRVPWSPTKSLHHHQELHDLIWIRGTMLLQTRERPEGMGHPGVGTGTETGSLTPRPPSASTSIVSFAHPLHHHVHAGLPFIRAPNISTRLTRISSRWKRCEEQWRAPCSVVLTLTLCGVDRSTVP